MILLDTTVLIDQLRGRPEARLALRQAARQGNRFIASAITRAEVIAGARTAELPYTLATLDRLDWIPVTAEIAERAGWLANEYRAAHGGIDLADYLIAASVEATGAAFWTRNVRHFPMFPGLRAPY